MNLRAQASRRAFLTARRGWRTMNRFAASRIASESDTSRPLPHTSSWMQDLAYNRPWNLLLKLARVAARVAPFEARGAATILIVNWETPEVTADVVAKVLDSKPSYAKVLVIDNASGDGSAAYLRSRFGNRIRLVRLPRNVGHAIALDLGIILANSEFVVTLDSDAIPVNDNWFDTIMVPMNDKQVILCGSRSSRDFVHPIFACVRRREFVRRGLSWQPWRVRETDISDLRWGIETFDTGELLSRFLQPQERAYLERTQNLVEGLPGMTVAGVVYHHGGVTRSRHSSSEEYVDVSWRSAVAALLETRPSH